MTAYDDVIGRARRLLRGSDTVPSDYWRALIELCATFDPDREMDEALDRARDLLYYEPERTVTFTINVPDIDLTDEQVAVWVASAINHYYDVDDRGVPFALTSEVEVES